MYGHRGPLTRAISQQEQFRDERRPTYSANSPIPAQEEPVRVQEPPSENWHFIVSPNGLVRSGGHDANQIAPIETYEESAPLKIVPERDKTNGKTTQALIEAAIGPNGYKLTTLQASELVRARVVSPTPTLEEYSTWGEFECKLCRVLGQPDRTFRRKWDLLEHHRGHLPHQEKCPNCDRPFKHKRNLKRHMSKCNRPPLNVTTTVVSLLLKFLAILQNRPRKLPRHRKPSRTQPRLGLRQSTSHDKMNYSTNRQNNNEKPPK
jgi:hypothetical protein